MTHFQRALDLLQKQFRHLPQRELEEMAEDLVRERSE